MIPEAVVLAGGRSSRLGADKAGIVLARRDGNVARRSPPRDLLVTLTDELLLEFARVTVVGRAGHDGCDPAVRFFPDLESGLGPLGGLATALVRTSNEAVFLVGCDMPFVTRAAVRALLHEADGAWAAGYEVEGFMEPLFAVYAKALLPAIFEAIATGGRSLQPLFRFERSRRLSPPCEILRDDPFQDIDTREDLARARSRAAHSRP